MGIVFKNNAKTTLASSLSNSATSATVTDGSVFPTLGAGEFFLITFDDGTNNEICKCTARSSNTLTIVRAQDNTSARSFSSGDAAEGRVTAGVLETIQENIAAKSADQTVYNATTASSATAYNIGIDPGVEANAMVFLDGVMQHHDTFSFSGSTLTFDAAPTDGTKLEVIVDNLINLQSSNLTVDSFTAADVGGSAQTDFTLSDTPAAETNLIVFVEGVFQDQDAYTISSNTLTITTGVIAGRGVTVYVINPVNIGTPSDGTITSAKLSGNLTLPGTLTVGANDVAFDSPTFVVDNSNSRVGLGTASPTVPVDIVGETKMSSHLTLGTTSKVQFGDSGTYIHQSADGVLDLVSDTEIEINATTIDVNGNLDVSGTIASGGVLTANAGVVVDNITIDGTEIDLSSGDLTIDVAGDIILDADGGTISLKDGGTQFGFLEKGGSDKLSIKATIQDADIAFFGNDGGSEVTALTLDMSEAGAATFNAGIKLSGLNGGTGLAFDMAGSGDYVIKESSTNDVMSFQGGLFHNFSNNRIGIGTASPSSKLHLESGNAHNKLSITSTASGGTGYDAAIDLLGSATNSEVQLNMGINGDADREQIKTYQSAMSFRTNNAERMRLHSTGKLTVGSTPTDSNGVIEANYTGNAFTLYLTATQQNYFGFASSETGGQAWSFRTAGSGNYGSANGDLIIYNGSSTEFMRFDQSASTINGDFNDTSDIGLKENITDTTDGLSKLLQLQPRKFDWKDEGKRNNVNGFIAQEVETVLPDEVIGDDYDEKNPSHGHKSINTSGLLTVAVKSIQEQQVLIEALQKEVEELKGG